MKVVAEFWSEAVWLLRNQRGKVVLCAVVAAVGTICGVVLFKANYNWWHGNRCAFAEKLVYGNVFSLFLSFVLSAVVVSALCCAPLLSCHSHKLLPLSLLVVSIYFGANLCAVFAGAGLALGFLYALCLAAGFAVNWLCAFLSLCCCPCKRTFGEIFADNKIAIALQVAAIFAKLLIIFVLLRGITALI